MNDSSSIEIAEHQATLNLGRGFEDIADRTVRLMHEGECLGRFVRRELMEETLRVLEHRASFPVTGLRMAPGRS